MNYLHDPDLEFIGFRHNIVDSESLEFFEEHLKSMRRIKKKYFNQSWKEVILTSNPLWYSEIKI